MHRLGDALAQDPDLDGVPSLPRMRPMVSGERGGVDGHAVDRRDDIAGANPGRGGRRTVEGRDHHDLPVLHRHLDADARVLARTRDLDVVVLFAVQIRGVGIQRGHHAADGRLQQLMIVHGVDVSRARRARALRPAGAHPARARLVGRPDRLAPTPERAPAAVALAGSAAGRARPPPRQPTHPSREADRPPTRGTHFPRSSVGGSIRAAGAAASQAAVASMRRQGSSRRPLSQPRDHGLRPSRISK